MAGTTLKEHEVRTFVGVGGAISRVKTVIDGPSALAWSSGTENSCSVTSIPGTLNVAATGDVSTAYYRYQMGSQVTSTGTAGCP